MPIHINSLYVDDKPKSHRKIGNKKHSSSNMIGLTPREKDEKIIMVDTLSVSKLNRQGSLNPKLESTAHRHSNLVTPNAQKSMDIQVG